MDLSSCQTAYNLRGQMWWMWRTWYYIEFKGHQRLCYLATRMERDIVVEHQHFLYAYLSLCHCRILRQWLVDAAVNVAHSSSMIFLETRCTFVGADSILHTLDSAIEGHNPLEDCCSQVLLCHSPPCAVGECQKLVLLPCTGLTLPMIVAVSNMSADATDLMKLTCCRTLLKASIATYLHSEWYNTVLPIVRRIWTTLIFSKLCLIPEIFALSNLEWLPMFFGILEGLLVSSMFINSSCPGTFFLVHNSSFKLHFQ